MLRYSRACGSYQDFFVRGLLLTRNLLNQGFLLVKLKSSLRKFYGHHNDLVDTNGHGYVPLVVNTSRSFPHSRLITVFVTRLTRRVPLVEQELLTLPEYRSSPPVFNLTFFARGRMCLNVQSMDISIRHLRFFLLYISYKTTLF